MELLLGSIEQGLIFGILALGVYLTFRVLNFPDLTVDGSFPLGGAVAATLIVAGVSPAWATAAAFFAGILAGLTTALMNTKGGIHSLLAGILTMTGLYSINLRIMGTANVSLLRKGTLFTPIEELSGWMRHAALVGILLLVVLVVKLLLDAFLRTDLGLALRASGDNPRMAPSLGIDPHGSILLGLALANALVALSGALMAQFQGYADIQMGIGMIVVGLASVILGEAVVRGDGVFRATLAAVVGAVLYRLVIAGALSLNLQTSDMKLVTALLVLITLLGPRIWPGRFPRPLRES